MFVPAGYVKLEGATVNRSNYPRLVALANKYSLWTTDTVANPGLFGKGNGSTTMVLPNWAGRMAQFAATAGGAVAAGLPNIVGTENIPLQRSANGFFPSGMYKDNGWSNIYEFSGSQKTNYTTTNFYARSVGFDASLSSSIYGSSTTVQPPAINTFAIMRY